MTRSMIFSLSCVACAIGFFMIAIGGLVLHYFGQEVARLLYMVGGICLGWQIPRIK